MGILRRLSLRITVRRVAQNILDEAGKKIMDGAAPNIHAALKQFSTEGAPYKVPDDGNPQTLFLHMVWIRVTRELCFDPQIQNKENAHRIGEIALRYYYGKIIKLDRQYAKLRNQYIETVAKKTTHELINYLEAKVCETIGGVINKSSKRDGLNTEELEALDFFKPLKEYVGEESITCPINNFSSDKCAKWLDLFLLIVWKKTKEGLATGTESDFRIMSTAVLIEVEQWKRVLRDRASGD